MEPTTEKTANRLVTMELERCKAPVFVVGCPRSGTTMLYHMLLSAGNFAVYRSESNVFSILQPRFGNLRSKRNRRDLLRYWLKSYLFESTGLEAESIRQKIMHECRSTGDFLSIVMQEVARRQGVERWADTTPDHLLFIPQIKQEIPNALFVHIIRDGRDVALSYAKQGWAHPLPWDRGEELSVAGLYWEWIVSKGRKYGRAAGANYCEVRYEDLVEKPRETLRDLGVFLGRELDYEQIMHVGIGAVSAPNSSFTPDPSESFHPVGRWAGKMTVEQLMDFESLVGGGLRELGYKLSSEGKQGLRARRLRYTYRTYFTIRHQLKCGTPLGRFSNIARMGIPGLPSAR